MQRLFTCLTFCLFVVISSAVAQSAPVFNNFYANPFQFNPAYIVNNGYSEANVLYRKQWLDINNAPTTMAVNFQAPMGRNVAVGLTGYSDKTILLNTTVVLGTFGYRVRFGSGHHLNFALSGGVGFNNFDLEALGETNDPVLTNISRNNTFLSGQFGLNYQLKNFNFGFALPQLFQSKANSAEAFNEVNFNEFDDKFASVSYAASIGQSVRLVPMVIYRSFGKEEDQFEGALIVNIKRMLWVGGSYRQDYGITGFIGINIKNLLRIGYAYEKATSDISKVSGDTHEIFIGARLGKHNREEAIITEWQKKDSVEALTVTKPEKEIEAKEREGEERKVVAPEPGPTSLAQNHESVEQPIPTVVEVTEEPEPMIEEKDDTEPVVKPLPEVEESKVDPLTPGHYVIVGAYKNLDNALKQVVYLKQRKMDYGIIFIPDKELHYVYVFHSGIKDITLQELRKVRRENVFYGAWIYTVE